MTVSVKAPTSTTGSIQLNGSDVLTIDSSGNLTVPNNLTVTGSITGDGSGLTSLPSLGIGQTWTGVAGSRSTGVTYTNSTGKPIAVAISYTNSTASTVQGLTINGKAVYAAGAEVGNGSGFCLIVPNGATYIWLTNGGTSTIVSWDELR